MGSWRANSPSRSRAERRETEIGETRAIEPRRQGTECLQAEQESIYGHSVLRLLRADPAAADAERTLHVSQVAPDSPKSSDSENKGYRSVDKRVIYFTPIPHGCANIDSNPSPLAPERYVP